MTMNNKKRPWMGAILLLCSTIAGCGGDGGGSGMGGTGVAVDTPANIADAPPFTTPENLVDTVFDPSQYTAVTSATLDGTWMLIESSEEMLSTPGAASPVKKFRETSRQIVTIRQLNNSAQIQLCNGVLLGATLTGDTLTYEQPISIDADESSIRSDVPVSVALNSSANGYLYGEFDSGPRDGYGFYIGLQYRLQRKQMFVRISSATENSDIGSANLTWSPAGQYAGSINCFAESVREEEIPGVPHETYDSYERPTKKLILGADAVRITFIDMMSHSHPEGDSTTYKPFIEHRVAVENKSGTSSNFFGGGIRDVSAQEEESFSPATPQLLRQQYTSAADSINGAIQFDLFDGFVHGDLSLHW